MLGKWTITRFVEEDMERQEDFLEFTIEYVYLLAYILWA